jgi:hypothetical protein
MVYKTQKKKIKEHKEHTRKKRCYTDNDIGEICSTGQYSTYAGNFYKNKNNLDKFSAIKQQFKTIPQYKKYKTQSERYTKFLKDNFRASELPKVVAQVKNDYYTYANEEWLKETDIEKGKKNYYVQYDTFRIAQE